MFEDHEYLASPLPFWFASPELLSDVYRAELTLMSRLLNEDLELPKLFDTPEATWPQRSACFVLLAHRKLAKIAEETLVEKHEQPPSPGEVELDAFYRTLNLVPPDAPAWVLDVDKVVELLPHRMLELLPEPLRRQGFDRKDDSAQLEAMQSFSTVEQIQTFTEGVLDQQLRRLERRWSATPTTIVQVREPKKRRPNKRKGWEQREKLYCAIREVLTRNPSLQGMKFCAELDKRHALPLYDWVKVGQWRDGLTWKEAWNNPDLLPKIRRVRQEAMKNR